MTKLIAYTDGACSGNPGPGGWGALMRAMDGDKIVKERELKGGEPATTNNRMELMAAISALEALARPTEITIVTDSNYVKNGITGCMGGLMRDVVVGEVPLVLQQGELYVTAAFAGAATAVIIRSILGDDALALFAGACMTWILRAGSLYFGWHLPVYKSRPPRV